MSDTPILKRLASLMDNFPQGEYVWHKADGRRGIVMGYLVSATKVPHNSEKGDEWQEA